MPLTQTETGCLAEPAGLWLLLEMVRPLRTPLERSPLKLLPLKVLERVQVLIQLLLGMLLLLEVLRLLDVLVLLELLVSTCSLR